MTSPPSRRRAASPGRYRPAAVGSAGSPFHVGVHDPRRGAWMNASVKWRAPDRPATLIRRFVVQVSKYGAKTCAGSVRGWPSALDGPGPKPAAGKSAGTSTTAATIAVRRR